MQVLKELMVNGNFNIQKGYLALGPITLKNHNPGSPNLSAGSVYQKGNRSRSFVNLTNLGTLIGAPSFDATEIGNEALLNNLLISLLAGFTPTQSGKWTSSQTLYSLQDIQDAVDADPQLFFSKVLGMGLGNMVQLAVGTVNTNGTETLAYTEYGTEPATVTTTSDASNILSVLNWGNGLETLESDDAFTYPSPYLEGFDWQDTFGIQLFNGTNSFPFYGWAGTRVGDIQLVNSQTIQNAVYDFPATELKLSKVYDSLGIVYAGQGTQYSSVFLENQNRDIISRNVRKRETTLNRTQNKLATVNSVPYQQGIGSYDFFANTVNYETNTSVSTTDNIPAEGAQPGRNTAFAGVAITDFWSNNLDFTQINEGSRTADVVRSKIPKIRQSQTAHNAPLCYIPVDSDTNSEPNVLPWNTLFSYVGDTTTSPNYTRSEKVSILQEGITSMVVTGAFPMFMGQWCSTVRPTNTQFFDGSGNGNHQYYFNPNWWAPVEDPAALNKFKTLDTEPVLSPYPPFTIKGGTLFLYEGQRVKAGSYVYSTTMVSTLSVPHFYAPSAKRITFAAGERDSLLGDIFSRFQGNQGGIIVMVSEDGQPPPMPPPGAQPIGIVMEDVEGFGTPGGDNPYEYTLQLANSTAAQPTFPNGEEFDDPLLANNIMGREILIKLLPMYSNYYLPGVPDLVTDFSTSQSIANPFTYATNGATSPSNPDFGLTYYPIYYRVKTHYAITTGIFNGTQPNDQNWFSNQQALTVYGLTFNR